MEKVVAPWTQDQVKSLNEYQKSGVMHPFTGVNENAPDGEDDLLIATEDGWVSKYTPDYKQDWAYEFMVDGSWKEIWNIE